MFKYAMLLIFILALPSAVHAQSSTYRCTFGEGVTTEWEHDKFNTQKASMSDPGAIMVFDQIDTQKRTARMIGNAGADDVTAIQTAKTLSFIEISPSGNIFLTSIFTAMPTEDWRFPAVHSRHIHISEAALIPQQYYGTCIAQ